MNLSKIKNLSNIRLTQNSNAKQTHMHKFKNTQGKQIWVYQKIAHNRKVNYTGLYDVPQINSKAYRFESIFFISNKKVYLRGFVNCIHALLYKQYIFFNSASLLLNFLMNWASNVN